ncbi:MAG: hypothetical protein ACXVDB_02515, partial [Tumebacillaceae bacterium]
LERETGNVHSVQFRILSKRRVTSCNQVNGWKFNWRESYDDNFSVVGMTLKNCALIQGLISYKVSKDHGAIVLDVLESAPHNKGREGDFDYVGENLLAYAGIMSFRNGFDGYVFLRAKTGLIDYYRGLGADCVRDRDFVFRTKAISTLINQYIGGDDTC